MSSNSTKYCDCCDNVIIETEKKCAVIMFIPPRAHDIGDAYDSFDICENCLSQFEQQFPRMRATYRLVQPVHVPPPNEVTPPGLDTVSPEALLVLLAQKLGVKVEKT